MRRNKASAGSAAFSLPRRRPFTRRPLRPLTLFAALLGAACFLSLAGTAVADKGLNDGIFRDREGKQNTWSILRSHLLMWNEQPYTPAGLVFHSAYLAAPTPENLQKDTAELDRYKAAGVQDVWIDSQRGLLSSSVEQIQAVVDALEARGFRYGLRVGDRTQEPLIGFSPTLPTVPVAVDKMQPGTLQAWDVKVGTARRVLFNLVDLQDEKVQNMSVATGEAVVERDSAHLEARIPRSSLLGKNRGRIYVVPEVQVEPDELGSFGDLWTGMPTYEARLKKHLSALKFGSGFRFLIDPFSAGDGTVGQEDVVFPSSVAFRKAFGDWLQTRTGLPSINTNWRLRDQRIYNWETVARLVPTWPRNDPPDGDAWLIDPVEHKSYRCRPRDCSIWQDLDNFRADTLKRWMNVISTDLKLDGLNVPMLFTWANYHPIFINSPSPAGYDGLAGELYGSPATVGKDSAAYALAEAEEADRNSWLVATRLAGPLDPNGKPAALGGVPEITQAWNNIRDAGFRGVFFDPTQVPAAMEAVRQLPSLIASDVPAMKEKIPVCFFPMPLATADRVTRLSNGVWWLPSGAPARLLRFGDDVMGYVIDRPFGEDSSVPRAVVLWSLIGKQESTFYLDPSAQLALYDSAAKPVKFKSKKGEFQMVLTEEPLVATGVDPNNLFPLELASARLDEFDSLLRQAEAQRLDTAPLRAVYDQAKKSLTPADAPLVYNSITPYITRLRDALQPFIWIEGERSVSQNFGGLAFQAGSSGGTYLKLNRLKLPLSGPYHARYTLEIRRDASYEIWVAGKAPGRPGVSPLIWQVDDEPAVPLEKANPVGPDYATGLCWFQLGRMTLKAGQHSLTLVVADKSEGAEGRYAAGVDAVVLSRDPFQPNGVQKPYNARGKDARKSQNDRSKASKKSKGDHGKDEKKGSDDKTKGSE